MTYFACTYLYITYYPGLHFVLYWCFWCTHPHFFIYINTVIPLFSWVHVSQANKYQFLQIPIVWWWPGRTHKYSLSLYGQSVTYVMHICHCKLVSDMMSLNIMHTRPLIGYGIYHLTSCMITLRWTQNLLIQSYLCDLSPPGWSSSPPVQSESCNDNCHTLDHPMTSCQQIINQWVPTRTDLILASI